MIGNLTQGDDVMTKHIVDLAKSGDDLRLGRGLSDTFLE